MRWPWTKTIERAREPDTLDRILALMERQALEEQQAKAHERDVLLNEAHRRLTMESVDDPALRLKLESKLLAAREQGWEPKDAV